MNKASNIKKGKNTRSTLRLFGTGFMMGSADIVPGVSGGTIAFIFGVYEELIYSIKLITGKALKLLFKGKVKEGLEVIPFSFLIPLGIGILSAILTLAGIISHLLKTQPVYLWSFFFGLVVASIILVSRRVVKWGATDIIALLFTSIAGYIIVGSVPVETPANLLAFFLSGAVAICAMILPGVSGSFLLIIMGKYSQILTAVTQKDFLTLGAVALGAIIGLAFFSRILSWLFSKHHDITIAGLTGFMIGSLRKLWPWKDTLITRINSHGEIVPLQTANKLPEVYDVTIVTALILALIGAGIILYLNRLHITEEHIEDIKNKSFKKSHSKALKSQEK